MVERALTLRRGILLSVVSAGVFLGITELAARLFFCFPHDIDYGIYPGVCGDHLPLQDIVAIHTSYDTADPFRVRINSEGLRGAEIAVVKKPGVCRILCLGDSFTYGLYLSEGDTFPDRLQKYLDDNSRAGRFEVINAGHLDYTVREEMEYLKERGLKLKPDWVVLQFTALNDIEDLVRPESMRYYYSRLSIKNRWVRAGRGFLRKWRFYGLMVYTWTRLRARWWYDEIYPGKKDRRFKQDMYFDGVDRTWKLSDEVIKTPDSSRAVFPLKLETLWNSYAGMLKNLVQLLDERGIRLAIVMYPAPGELGGAAQSIEDAGYSWKAGDFMSRLVRNLSIADYVDLTIRFKDVKRAGKDPICHKLHPTAEANEIAAQEVGALIRNYYIPGH